MMNHKKRIDKLSKANLEAPIIVLMPGEELTEAQRLEIAKAEAAGIKPIIVRFELASKMAKVKP